jgi:hypothetical protein
LRHRPLALLNASSGQAVVRLCSLNKVLTVFVQFTWKLKQFLCETNFN